MELLSPNDMDHQTLAAHLRTEHALVPRRIDDLSYLQNLHATAQTAAVPHEHLAAGTNPPATAAAWRGTVRLVGVPEGAEGDPPFAVIELADGAAGMSVGSVVTILPGDGLRG